MERAVQIQPAADAEAAPDRQPEGRTEPRSNIFVVATIYSDAGSGPVRIRNMSRGGALIEGAVIPAEGTALRLSRGSLSVSGQIVWRSDNRAGVRFDSAVSVPDWLPSGSRATGGQQRIDEAVHAYRSLQSANASTPSRPVPIPGESELPADLGELHQALSRIVEEIAQDAALCARYPTALQTIDVAAQTLAKLAAKFAR